MINNYFSENRVFRRQCEIIWYSQIGHRLQYHYDAGKMRFIWRMAKARIQTRNRARVVTGTCHNIPVYVNRPLCFVRWRFLSKFSNLDLNFMKDKNRGSRMNFGEYSSVISEVQQAERQGNSSKCILHTLYKENPSL
jgi:hypothetical protein